MEYMEGMEVLESDVMTQVLAAMNQYDYEKYTAEDVRLALANDIRTPKDFGALLSPAAAPFLEEMAQLAQQETRKHFGNSVYMFTPIYISNYCENYCIYCGFNCRNKIQRAKLTYEEIEKEMEAIAATGLEEILILVGESRKQSDVEYLGEACKIARRYFKMVGLEVYPMNSDEYAYLHECGADYVTVFQETYDSDKYETLHLGGHKRVFPYRVNARAVCGAWDSGRCWGWLISGKMRLLQESMHGCCRGSIRRQRLHFHVQGSARLSTTIKLTRRMCMKHSFCR